MSKISSFVTILLFAFFISAFSAKKIQPNTGLKFKVSQKLSDCWSEQLIQGVLPKGETDISKFPIYIDFGCRTNEKTLQGVNYRIDITKCLFDSLGIMNLDKKRYRECIRYEFIEGKPFVFKATCRNVGYNTIEWVKVDLHKFYSVKNGVPACTVRKQIIQVIN